MKKSIMALIALLILIQPTFAQEQDHKEFRGMWVATVLNLDYPSETGQTIAELKMEASKILDQVEALGMNAVVLQVRPTGDAFYKSEIFPWSKYISGRQGTAPSDAFDPLEYWIEEAHKRNIEIHAWINPYRITRKTSDELAHDTNSLSKTNPAILNPEWVVKHSDGNMYYDPGLPEVIDLIVSGVVEIVEKYDVDGIHFDDYFYPGTEFDDGQTYMKYGSSYGNIHDWRRSNINKLIEKTYRSIKAIDPTVQFGVSPFAIWMNSKNHPSGSATNGLESYTSHYADTKLWVQEEIIDYIAPQIYWNIGYEIADYQVLLNWWNNVVDGTSVDLFIGHAAYRVESQNQASPWYGVSEIQRQLDLNKSVSNVSGSIFFRYDFFEKHYSLRSLIKNYYNGMDSQTINEKLIIGRPFGEARTTVDHYFIGGSSNPKEPLYLNGKLVENRTQNGYFGVFLPLEKGVNDFVFTQGTQRVVKTITRIGVTSVKPLTNAALVEGTAWPKTDVAFMPGETVQLSVTAPAGASVKAKINGRTYDMKKSSSTYSNDMMASKFYYEYEVPHFQGHPRVISLGPVEYEMSYKNKLDQLSSKGTFEVFLKGAPFLGTIVPEFADSYESSSTSKGSHYLLLKGMSDLVTGKENGLYRLSSGIWVKEEFIKVSQEPSLPRLKIMQISHNQGEGFEELVLSSNGFPIAGAQFDGEVIHLEIARTIVSKINDLGPKSSIEIVSSQSKIEHAILKIKPKDLSKFGGYELINEDGQLKLRIYERFIAQTGESPLLGAKILIDPGHGGTDNGGIGLQGGLNTEKTVNLNIALQLKDILEQYGASVQLTRSEDVYMSLGDRLAYSKNNRPDLFVSIHADSVGENLNLSQVRGFSVFYKDPLAKDLADTIQRTVVSNLNRSDRKVKTANFYVVRGTWAPSILIESGFMPNPLEYEWLMDSNEQRLFSYTIADAIHTYFKSK